MSVTPCALSEGPAQAENGPRKKRFSPFSSIREGLQRRREKKKVLALLESAIRFDDKEAFSEAMAAFSALPSKQREKIMLGMQERLIRCSTFAFESADRTRELAGTAAFFEAAAKTLPLDENGERITAQYSKTIKVLSNTLERTEFRRAGRADHSEAIPACARALWELEYGRFSFWEDRASDSATRDFVVKQMLDMAPTENFEEHGWFLLRKNLKELGMAVAKSDSENKLKFFFAMMMDEDKEVVKAALRAAVYMDQVPVQLFTKAYEISATEGLEAEAKGFIGAANFKNLFAEGGEQRHFAAMQLVLLYRSGMDHLKPLLENVGAAMVESALAPDGDEKQRLNSLNVLTAFASLGIMPYGADTLRSVLSPLVASRPAAALLYNLTGTILNGQGREDLRRVAQEMESARIDVCRSEFSYADDRQFDAAAEFIFLYQTGRMKSRLDLMQVGLELAEVATEPAGEKPEQRQAQKERAESLLDAMAPAGITIRPGSTEIEEVQESIEMLLHSDERRFIDALEAIDTLRPTVWDQRLELVRLGLDMAELAAESAGGPSENGTSDKEAAEQRAAEKKSAESVLRVLRTVSVDIKADAAEAKRIKGLLEALEPSNESVFDTASELVGLYKNGKADLSVMIYVGVNMARVLAEPSAETTGGEAVGASEEAPARKQKAESVLAALREAGVNINVNIKNEDSEATKDEGEDTADS